MANGTRKYKRSRGRPSNMRYTAEQRWVKNKRLAIARDARLKAKAAAKKAIRKARAMVMAPQSARPQQAAAAP